MAEKSPQYHVAKRAPRKREHARLPDLSNVPTDKLWKHAHAYLSLAISHGEAYEDRQAFYDTVRAMDVLTELHLRGEQLQFDYGSVR